MRESTVLREVPLQSLPEVRPVRKVETWRHDADDEMVRTVETHGFANDRPVAIETASPQPIADHRLEVAIDVESGVARERRPELWRDAKHTKKIATRLHRRHAHRIADAVGERDLRHPPTSDVFEVACEATIVEEVHRGES